MQEKASEGQQAFIQGELQELCPKAPGELLQALLWLYHHQELGAYLCGRGPEDRGKRQELLRQLQEDGHPAYLALASYALLLEKKNGDGENKR